MWKHGYAKTPTYVAYQNMMTRCYNVNTPYYHNYGGRGITVCMAWRVGFKNFLRHMGERPAGMSLERVNNDGPYHPRNCRWATKREQERNRRTNVVIDYQGRTQCVSDWAAEVGLDVDTLYYRLFRSPREWSVAEALFTPSKKAV